MLLGKNQNSISGKVCAGMASLILAFTCMPGFTILANQISKQENKSIGERTADWKDEHGSGTLHAKKVELTADSKDVKAIGKDGYLAIDETRDDIRRQLKIEPAADGKLKRTYSVDGVTQEMDETAKAWLAKILHDSIASVKVMP